MGKVEILSIIELKMLIATIAVIFCFNICVNAQDYIGGFILNIRYLINK
jgi:hypothetical protein